MVAARKLLPAEQIRDGDKSFHAIRSPVLRGWVLTVAVWLLESFLGSLILKFMWRKSGIQQALREVEIPEAPSFEPFWPHPPQDEAEFNIEALDPRTRAAIAAHAIPGFDAIRDTDDMDRGIRRWDIADYAQAYSSFLVTPLDVANSILEKLQQSQAMDPPMAFLASQDPEDLLGQARAATIRFANRKQLSPLDGVPFAVIDAVDALPYPTSAGTSYLGESRPVREDAPAVTALQQAGAMLVGKASCHELGLGMTGVNAACGTPRNPHRPSCCAGGSSSGSAAIVSAGICAFAIGMDGGGSVRVPAALCGVTGFKPTAGRTSRSGCPETAFSIMSLGPLTACVGDAMLVNAVISNAGTKGHASQPAASSIPRSLYNDMPGQQPNTQPLRGKRVGVYFHWAEAAAPEVLAAFKRSLKVLASLGCKVVDVEIPELELVRVAQMISIGCEIAEACKHAYAHKLTRRRMNLDSRVTLASTSRFLATDFLQAQKIRSRLLCHMRRIFQEVDFIATPTVGITAPELSDAAAKSGESDMVLTGDLMRFTIPVNMAGLPAISLPMGHDSKGLPMGLQLVGQAWREADLFYAASAVESCTRTQSKPPAVNYDVLFGRL